MSAICAELHHLVSKVKHYEYPFVEEDLPQNGIYIMFEKVEMRHGTMRIVRIGTHDGQNNLRSRLREHYMNENKDRSIFRKNIGRALLNKSNDLFLEKWEIDHTPSNTRYVGAGLDIKRQKEVEAQVSAIIRANFSFCLIPLSTKEERKYYEARLIGTVSNCSECRPSSNWLGLHSPVEKIRQSGMWNVNHLWTDPLTIMELALLQQKM